MSSYGASLGSFTTFILPKIWWACFWQKPDLQDAVDSLKLQHKHILGKIREYRAMRERLSDIGGTLDEHIADLRRVANEMEDCIDSCHIAEATRTRAELLRKIPRLKERSEKLEEDYKGPGKSTGEETTTSRHQGGTGTSGHGQSYSGGDFRVVKPSCADPVDMDGPIKELLDLVKVSDSEPESKQLKVISISGFGGLGKTLLADKVYFHEDVCAQFRVRARVEAAGKSHDEVLEEILKQVPGTSANDEEIRQNGEQRFLIVIVDIQENRGEIAIASVLKGLGEVHSRVIVTTTIQSIATSWASPNNHLYPMSTLNKVHWEELFFREFEEGKCKKPSEMGQLSSLKSLLEKCDGLPLALISTAKVLSGTELDNKACTEAWKKLCDIKHDETSTLQKMQRVLASTCAGLSGTNVPPTLIDCLLYFSMFPPNHHVRKNSLIRRWLAEGMKQNVDRKEFDLEQHIERLIDRSIIQSMEVSTRGDVKGCKASSLMYEYIFHRSKSEEFMAVLSDVMDNGFERKGYVRRLSIHATETGIAEERLPNDLSHLHTLAVFGTEKPEVTEDLANGLFGNKGVLAKYKVLRVLDLKECAGLKGKHLQTICDLLLLKYLSLGDSIVQVPRKIAQLKLLETLDLSRTIVVTVYMEVLGLPNLTHLLGKIRLSRRDCIFGVEKLKRFVRNKCKLDTLGGFTTGKSETFPQLIGDMRQLNKVKIWIHPTADTRNLEHLTKGIKEFVRKSRFESNVGRSLSVDFSECVQEHAERSLHFLTLPQTEKVKENVNIPDNNTQGAQIKQEGEANQCFSSINGGSTSNQIMNMQDNIEEHQTEEIDEAKQGAPSHDACCRNETEMMQNHQNIREGYDKCQNKLSSLKLSGELPKFPLQFVTEIAGIERLCLSSTGLSGQNIADALSELPDLFYLKLREDDLSLLDLQNKQFPSLRRVCFSVKDGNLPHPTIIKHFRNLREVYLYANPNYEARRSWKAASESHPERPRVYFAESKFKGTSSEAVTQNQ